MVKRAIILERLRLISTGAATENIDLPRIDENWRAKITKVSVENRTSAMSRVVLGIVRGGVFHIFEEENWPQADDVTWSDGPFYLTEGDVLRVQVAGATSGDEIVVFVNGYKWMEE